MMQECQGRIERARDAIILAERATNDTVLVGLLTDALAAIEKAQSELQRIRGFSF